ncbi:phenylacetic acid degradation protein [Acidovorax sp.]|uniref:phenylacetic acid degradation protein n=1 Tax=Acidovorax sp. TaxID=1872122 RepID=UPI003919BEB4
MGVILQILGLIITFTMAMEALRRFGIDVGWLNPLAFFRRRAWAKKVTTPPLYTLEHPVDVVAVMALAMVQATGAVTVEQKHGVLALLRQHLALADSDANSLWVASSHMLRNRALAPAEVPAVLERSADKFTDYHVQTLRAVMLGAAQITPPASPAQQQLLDAVEAYFAKKQAAARPWAG